MRSTSLRALGLAALVVMGCNGEDPGRLDRAAGDRGTPGPDQRLADRLLGEHVADKAIAPPIPGGTWTRLDSGGGPFGAYFYRSVVLGDGGVWMGWGTPDVSASHGNFIFNALSNTWKRTNEVAKDPTKNIGARENYGAWYDGDRSCVWVGDGAPVAYGNPNGAQSGTLKYDIATDTFSLAYPNFGTKPLSIGVGDCALIYHGNSLYSFGGWSVGPGQGLKKHDLATDQIVSLATSSTPSFTEGPARLSYSRSGVDSNGKLWTLADGGELYQLDLKAATPEWSHLATTGQKPGNHNVGAALHEASNLIVAYLGKDGMVAADNGVDVGDTYLLDLNTRTWRYGPRKQQGDAVPSPSSLCTSVMNYDPLNKRVVITVAVGAGTEVWAYVPPAP
jgi:hypothetical protein